jgi:hypothetical protein
MKIRAIATLRYRREIREAVAALGYRREDVIKMRVDYHSWNRLRVEIPGKLDGVYDLDRHTFVD